MAKVLNPMFDDDDTLNSLYRWEQKIAELESDVDCFTHKPKNQISDTMKNTILMSKIKGPLHERLTWALQDDNPSWERVRHCVISYHAGTYRGLGQSLAGYDDMDCDYLATKGKKGNNNNDN